MVFTKQHYERIAAVLAWQRISAENQLDEHPDETRIYYARRDVIQAIELDLAAMFAEDNPRFDRAKFLDTATGVDND